jgi:uroporphyrin-III C-methyltransferase
LLTLRGAACLAQADVVMVDALVDRRVLAHCRPGAKIVDTGKRGHDRARLRQNAINRHMLRWARRGRLVVRLKGGDPYLFGRGGEEAVFFGRPQSSL